MVPPHRNSMPVKAGLCLRPAAASAQRCFVKQAAAAPASWRPQASKMLVPLQLAFFFHILFLPCLGLACPCSLLHYCACPCSLLSSSVSWPFVYFSVLPLASFSWFLASCSICCPLFSDAIPLLSASVDNIYFVHTEKHLLSTEKESS